MTVGQKTILTGLASVLLVLGFVFGILISHGEEKIKINPIVLRGIAPSSTLPMTENEILIFGIDQKLNTLIDLYSKRCGN